MKRFGYMMYTKAKKTSTKLVPCAKCGKLLTPAQACFYVDGCNCTITANAPAHCLDCYKAIYGIC